MTPRFWNSEAWYAYERAYGDEPGTRARLLDAATFATRVLDITPDVPTLWCGVRKSYHAIINKLERDPDFVLSTVTPRFATSFIDVAYQMQMRLEGHETRPRASWDVQAEWLRSGVGRAWLAWYRGSPVAFSYFIIWGRWACYGFARSEMPNANHMIMWTAIKTLKAEGVQNLELGWQGEATDKKGQDIEFFKRGWGGINVSPTLSGCAEQLYFKVDDDEL